MSLWIVSDSIPIDNVVVLNTDTLHRIPLTRLKNIVASEQPCNALAAASLDDAILLPKNDDLIDSIARSFALLGGRPAAVDATAAVLFANASLCSSVVHRAALGAHSVGRGDDLFVSLFPCHVQCRYQLVAQAVCVGGFPSAPTLMLYVDSSGLRLADMSQVASPTHGTPMLTFFADVLGGSAGHIVPKGNLPLFMALSTSHAAHTALVRHSMHFLRRHGINVAPSQVRSAALSLTPAISARQWSPPVGDAIVDGVRATLVPGESFGDSVCRAMGLGVALECAPRDTRSAAELFPTLRRTTVGSRSRIATIRIMRAVERDGKVAVAIADPLCVQGADAALIQWRSRADWHALPLRLVGATGGFDFAPPGHRAQRRDATRLELSQCRAIDARVHAAWNDDEIVAIFKRHAHVIAVLPGVRRRNWSTDGSETCVVVFVWLKGYMPDGEEPLPSRICGWPVDVREASCRPLGRGASAWIHLGQDRMVFPGSSLGGLPKDAGSVGAVLVHNGAFFALTAAHCVGEVGTKVRFPSKVDILPFLKAKSTGFVHWHSYNLDAALVAVDANAVFKCDTALLVPAHSSAHSAEHEPKPFVVGPLLSYGELREDDRFVLFCRSSGAVFEDDGRAISLAWSCGAVRNCLDGVVDRAPYFANQLVFVFAGRVERGDSGSVVFAIRDGKLRPVALVHRTINSDSIAFAVATPIDVVIASANADMSATFSFTFD
jgi:hypothetical protein